MRMIETLLGLRALFPYKVEGMEALKEKNGLTTSRGFPGAGLKNRHLCPPEARAGE